MSEILKRLRDRDNQSNAEVMDLHVKRRNFCVQELPTLAHDCMNKMVETEFRSATVGHSEIALRDGTHAAWKLASWPRDVLPNQVIETYEVYLLDTAQVVSMTKFWSGSVEIEPYDPSRYELTTVNAISIYHMLAELPGVNKFELDNLEKVPKK